MVRTRKVGRRHSTEGNKTQGPRRAQDSRPSFRVLEIGALRSVVASAIASRSHHAPCRARHNPVHSGLHMDAHARARELIDAAHAADPARTSDGRAAELVYGERVEIWVARLVPDASPALLLAARSQHLERWLTPRATFPEGKVGYLTWRRSLYVKQAARARALLLEAGVASFEADDVATWVSKTGLKTNPGTQALEDAAVLVFLENEISSFAAQHADYPREKFVDILRKTWRKLSPAAQQVALTLELPPAIAALVRDALASS